MITVRRFEREGFGRLQLRLCEEARNRATKSSSPMNQERMTEVDRAGRSGRQDFRAPVADANVDISREPFLAVRLKQSRDIQM